MTGYVESSPWERSTTRRSAPTAGRRDVSDERDKGAWVGLVMIVTLLSFCLAAIWQAVGWAMGPAAAGWLCLFAWLGVVLCVALSASLVLMGAAIAVPWVKYLRRVRERRG